MFGIVWKRSADLHRIYILAMCSCPLSLPPGAGRVTLNVQKLSVMGSEALLLLVVKGDTVLKQRNQ